MLAVEANMRAEVDGLRLRIHGSGSVLTCRLDGDPANLFEVVRRTRGLLPMFRAVVPLLVRSGLRFDVFVGGQRVASGGAGVKQNAPARLLRLASVRIGS